MVVARCYRLEIMSHPNQLYIYTDLMYFGDLAWYNVPMASAAVIVFASAIVADNKDIDRRRRFHNDCPNKRRRRVPVTVTQVTSSVTGALTATFVVAFVA